MRLRRGYLLICSAVALILSSLPHGTYYVPLPVGYITVYLGLLNPRPIRLVSSGDYSYGLYLYGYPLQQAVASLGDWAHHWWLSVAIAWPGALAIAYVSWHSLEKPALSLRRQLPVLENAALRLVGGSGQTVPWLGNLLALAALLGGVVATLLLVNANETAAAAVSVGTFVFAAALSRVGRPLWFPEALVPRAVEGEGRSS